MARHDDLLAQGPREAPEPESAEAATAPPSSRKLPQLRTPAIVLARSLSVFVIPLLFLAPKVGGVLAPLVAVALFGLRVYAGGRRVEVKKARQSSPLRPLVIVFIPITIAALVLAILSGFQPGDWIVVAVPAGILICLWLAERTIVHRRTASDTRTGGRGLVRRADTCVERECRSAPKPRPGERGMATEPEVRRSGLPS
jgi:hypothetical protein